MVCACKASFSMSAETGAMVATRTCLPSSGSSMNKQRFRLVFSQRMGMLVPVAEDRTARGKASGDGVAGGGTSSPSSRSSTDDARPWRTEAGLDLRKLVVGLISAWQLGFMLVAPMRAYAAPAGAA
ncbi:MAG: hypothetical protein EON57_18080 [Alphaproteobacteria bacterium]|nr:MAG: hypothetical protein EON57_18080 [Alphaproteobacteria bacterium]